MLLAGTEDPQLGKWPEGIDSPTVVQTFPGWPTFGLFPDVEVRAALVARHASLPPPLLSLCLLSPAQATVRNSSVYLHPTDICTPEIGTVQYEALRQLARASGSNKSDIDFRGQEVILVDWSAPLPVLSTQTKVASEQAWRPEGPGGQASVATPSRMRCTCSHLTHAPCICSPA